MKKLIKKNKVKKESNIKKTRIKKPRVKKDKVKIVYETTKPSSEFMIALAITGLIILAISYFAFGMLITAAVAFLFGLTILLTQILDHTNKKSPKRKMIKGLFIIVLIVGIVGILAFIAFFLFIVAKSPDFDISLLDNAETTLVYDNKNQLIATIGEEKREKITYDELPETLIDAVIATEDSRFFQHNGFDAPRFIKAALGQLLGRNAGGASTLTMQVVKNTFTSRDVSIIRKFTDIYLAIFKMEKAFTKEEIIEFYVNDPYLGSYSYGVEQASQTYFGKTASELNLSEAAVMAGLFQAPGAYDPLIYPEEADERRDTVLTLMVKHGYITKEEKDIASAISVKDLVKDGKASTVSEYQGYIDVAVDEVEQKTGLDPYVVPMIIYTNMDKTKQDGVNRIFRDGGYKWKDNKVQAGMAAVETNTGKIIALGSGRNRTGERVFNYATDIKKQIGSTAKPLFDYGPGIEFNNWSTYTLFVDEPYGYSSGVKIGNFDGAYKGTLTLREALRQSRNIPALKAFQQVDNASIKQFVTTLGLKPEIDANGYLHEAHSLGGFNGASPLQMAAAYAAFSNGGYYYEPYSVNKIIIRETEEELEFSSEKVQAMSKQTAYMITSVLQGVASDVGATAAAKAPMACKTGTTNYDSKTKAYYGYPRNAVPDGWLVGYSTKISMALWNGYDTNEKGYYYTQSQMSSHRKLLFRTLAKVVINGDGGSFAKPSGVSWVTVEKGSDPAMLPSANTPANQKVTELFKSGTEPTEISQRYIKLENVTDLTANYASGKVNLTWTHAPQLTLDENYAKKAGEFGYMVYKDNTLLGFTSGNSYEVETTSPYGEYIVKSTYKNTDTNRSSGSSVSMSSGVTFNYNGETSQILAKNATYTELAKPITVIYNSSDVTSSATITITYSNSVTGATTIDTSTPGVYTVTYKASYNGDSKTFTKTVTVTET